MDHSSSLACIPSSRQNLQCDVARDLFKGPSMPIQGKCHGCGKLLQVAEEFAGRVARCPHCGAAFKVPGAAATPPAGSPLAETAVATPVSPAAPALPPYESHRPTDIPAMPPAAPATTVSPLDAGDMGALLGEVE